MQLCFSKTLHSIPFKNNMILPFLKEGTFVKYVSYDFLGDYEFIKEKKEPWPGGWLEHPFCAPKGGDSIPVRAHT